MISTAIAPLEIATTICWTHGHDQRTKWYQPLSLEWGKSADSFAELVFFTAKGVDERIPEPGADSFSLEVKYSADADEVQGQLFKSLKLGVCDDR